MKHQVMTPKILVVDDEEAIRLPIELSLTNSGYTVIEAESGHQAIETYISQKPDLVLLDVLMNEMDGFSTCRKLRQAPQGEYLPIIMMTSLEDEQTILNAFEAGATDFIPKPLNLLILGFRVQYWLRSSNTLIDLNNSRHRLARAQRIARLAHWEWNLESDEVLVECSKPQEFGMRHKMTMAEVLEAIEKEDQIETRTILSEASSKYQDFSIHYRIIDEQDREHIIHNVGECFGDPQQTGIVRYHGIVQDVTALKKAERKIRYLAFYDSLTGLANRSLFLEYWDKLHAMASRNNTRIAVMFIDLDHFKQINDTLGHQVGDQVLIHVSDRLKKVMRNGDVIGRSTGDSSDSLISRVGGDEFNLLAPDLRSPENAATIAERIIESLAKPLLIAEHELVLTASIGICIFPEDGQEIDTLLKHADTAMYEAKKQGRNNFKFFHSDMNDVVLARFQLQNRLHAALGNGEFTLYYQPKVRGEDGVIKGVEALLRWIDPEKGLIPPDEFLPFAEENGFIHAINDWVIMEVCGQTSQWVKDGLFEGCRTSLNISGRDIDFDALEKRVQHCLEVTGLSPDYLEIELTERVMMQDTEAAKEVLMKLRALGISIAIDDFGTGYSALSHLQVFPLSTLKIDKSFVKDIESRHKNIALVKSIINIAKSLDLNVVAEGVETKEQVNALTEMACDELQGYYLGKPVPAEEFIKLLIKPE